MAMQPSPPSSSASSTDMETIQGPLTLAQLIIEIELITGFPIVTLATGRGRRGPISMYRRNGPPLVDLNLMVDAAVAQREADSILDAEARTAANLAVGRHRVSPKRAERVNDTIYFQAYSEDDQIYSVPWRP